MTNKRRWIIGKDGRRCGEYNCSGYDQANAKILRIDDDGTVHTQCRECSRPHTWKSREYKDRRACKSCRHVRDVTVRIWDGREHANEHCDACVLEQSAARHIATARQLAEKARKIRAARKPTTPTTEPTS